MQIPEFLKDIEREIKETQTQLEQAESLARLKEIAAAYDGEDRVISSYEIEKKIKSRGEEFKIMSGWKGLDDILKGFRLKQLVTVSAATKSGKTSWCVDLTNRTREHNPLWFPFEEGAEELIQKFIDRKEEPPLFYVPQKMSGNTLEWVEKKIVESVAKYNTRIVFVDHLHFIVPFSQERQDLRIGETMRNLKGLAKKWNVVIFIIAHLKKTKLEVQPDLEDLRDSSFIAQEADTVLMLWRKSVRENGQVVITDDVNLSVQANRRTGKTGNVTFVFQDGKFLEKDWEHVTEDQKAESDFTNF